MSRLSKNRLERYLRDLSKPISIINMRILVLDVSRTWHTSPEVLSELSLAKRSLLYQEARSILKTKSLTEESKKLFQDFLCVLRIIEPRKKKATKKQPSLRNDKKICAAFLRENRKELAKIARQHPKGNLIGETQVTQFKSARSNFQWATKRKRRP